MLNSAQKDVLLTHFIETIPLGELVLLPREGTLSGFTKGEIFAMLEHFVEKGFVRVDNLRSPSAFYKIQVKVAAHDFRRLGGFHGQEILFQQAIAKLLLEVEKLEGLDTTDRGDFKTIKSQLAEYIGIIASATSIADFLRGSN